MNRLLRFLNQEAASWLWRHPLLQLAAFVLALVPLSAEVENGHEAPFPSGLAALAAEEGTRAAEHFTKALQHSDGPNLRQNLALAHLLENAPAKALAQLEIARRQAPWDRELWKQKSKLRTDLDLTPAQRPLVYQLWMSLAFTLTTPLWLIAATASFWLGLGTFLLLRFSGRPARWTPILLLGLLCLGSVALALTRERSLNTVIIIEPESIILRTVPASTGPESGVIAPGARARIHGKHQNFFEVTSESGERGWISEQSATPLSVEN